MIWLYRLHSNYIKCLKIMILEVGVDLLDVHYHTMVYGWSYSKIRQMNIILLWRMMLFYVMDIKNKFQNWKVNLKTKIFYTMVI